MKYFAPTTGTVTASLQLKDAMTATPSIATTIQDVQARLVAPSAVNVPTLITVMLYVFDGAEQPTVGSCSFNPRVATSCSFAGPISVPANVATAWSIVPMGKIGPPENHEWDTFDLSLGFRSLKE